MANLFHPGVLVLPGEGRARPCPHRVLSFSAYPTRFSEILCFLRPTGADGFVKLETAELMETHLKKIDTLLVVLDG